MSTADTFAEALVPALGVLGLTPQPAQLELLARHFALLLEVNEQFNLTRVTDPADAAVKLYADSVATVAWSVEAGVSISRVLDVGTGAGFPAVPLTILAPHWRITALEATGKKARFVETARQSLGLENLTVVHAHSDHWKPPRRFDVAVVKAVGSIEACLTLAQRHVSPGGWAVLHKSATLDPVELEQGAAAAHRLGFTATPPWSRDLPLREGTFTCCLRVYVLGSSAASPRLSEKRQRRSRGA